MSHELARQLAQLLDPALVPVLDRIDAGTATPADLQALRDWPASHRAQVVDRVGSALPPVPGLAEALGRLTFAPEGWHPTASLGPAAIGVDCPAATVLVDGDTIVLGILPP